MKKTIMQLCAGLFLQVAGAQALLDFTPYNPVNHCGPVEVFFVAVNHPSSPVENTWYFGDGETAKNVLNPSHRYKLPGLFDVKLVVYHNGFAIDSVTKTNFIVIKPLPEAGILVQQAPLPNLTRVFVSSSKANADSMISYSWDFGAGRIFKESRVVFTFDSNGTYPVLHEVQNTAGCRDTALVRVTVVAGAVEPMSLPEEENSVTLKVYPSVTSGNYLTVHYSNYPARLRILNSLGQTLCTPFILSPQLQIDISELAPSVYYIVTEDGAKTCFTKFIKQ